MDSIPDYQQVTFHHVPECFPLASDVECLFTRITAFVANKNDWVGLYKVGWSSSKEFITYEWASNAKESQELKVIFKEPVLPKDDGEFYQFCYVTGAGQVRGVSSPFQFKAQMEEDFVEIEDFDDDIMIIKSRTSALQDELNKVIRDRDVIGKKSEQLCCELGRAQREINELTADLHEETTQNHGLQEKYNEKVAELKELQQDSKHIHAIHDELRQKILEVKEEKAGLARQLEDRETYVRSLQEKIKSLVSEKDTLVGRARMLEEEKDLYKDNFASSESTVCGYVKEIDHLRTSLAEMESRCALAEEQNSTQNQELANTKKQLHVTSSCILKFKEDIEVLREQLTCSEEKIQALEQCKQSLGADLDAMTLTNNKLSTDVENSQSELHRRKQKYEKLLEEHQMKITSVTDEIQFLDSKLSEQNKENKRLQQCVQSLQQECDDLKDDKERALEKGQGGPMVALQSALDNLRARLQRTENSKHKLEKETAELVKYKTAQELHEAELVRTVADLTDRLKMCQQEYQDLYVETTQMRRKLKQSSPKPGAKPSAKSSPKQSDLAIQTDYGLESWANVPEDASLDIQAQMQELASELEKRREKCERYRVMYKDEVTKRREAEKQARQAEREIVALRNTVEVMKCHSKSPSPPPTAPDMREVTREFDPLMSRDSSGGAVSSGGACGHAADTPAPAETDTPTPADEGLDMETGVSTRRTPPAEDTCTPTEQHIQRDDNVPKSFTGWESHTSLPSNSCPVCQAVIESADALQRHVEAHLSAKQGTDRVCPMCDQVFPETQLDKLQEHVNSHLDA